MKSGYKVIFLLFSTLLLWACGGGGDGGIKDDGSSGGDDGGNGNKDTITLTLQLVDADGSPISEVSRATPGKLIANLKLNDAAHANQRITFELQGEGNLSQDSQVTDAKGIAEVGITTGDKQGAGTITATFAVDTETTTEALSFKVAGDLTPPHPIEQYSIQLQLIDESSNQAIQKVSHTSPGTLFAVLQKNGQPAGNEIVKFSIDAGGSINPSTGNALTNIEGASKVALLTGTDADAGTATASFSLEGESINSTLNYEVVGDAPGGGTTANKLTIQLLNNVTEQPISRISSQQPGLVSVLLSNQDNEPLAGKVVSFSSTLGSFIPSRGTALTDNVGRATILVTAGSIEGAGEVTASYGNSQAIIGFVTAGDEIDPVEASPAISFDVYDCSSSVNWDRNLRNFEVCERTDNITNGSPGIVGATVTRSGSTQTLNQVLVSATTTLGAVSPDSGTAITNDNGKVVFDLYANGQVGAGELTLTVKTEATTKAFEIGRVDIDLDLNSSLNGTSLPAGGSTVLDVTIANPNGSLATGQPYSLTFNSECKAAGKAVIDSPVVSIAGRAFTTYRSTGCEGDDNITVSASTGGSAVTDELTINVDDVNVGSIQYISAQPTLIALKGSGGITGAGSRTENSIVSFKLLDETGQAAPNELVCFELSTEVGGLSLAPQPTAAQFNACSNLPTPPSDLDALNKYAAAYTNNAGDVSVTVSAGNVPTPVKVYAQWQGSGGQGHNAVISNVSDQLVVSSGLADNDSFSLAASVQNPEAWNVDGQNVEITVRAADHFNNAVPEGTRVSFRSEGGSVIGTGSCDTEVNAENEPTGACFVTWTSADPRPFEGTSVVCPVAFNGITAPPCIGTNRDDFNSGVSSIIPEPRPGRATVTAYAIGEESFVDLNGNGLFDSGEPFNDIVEAFPDHNEDGVYRGNPVPLGAANEEPIDFNNDGQHNDRDGLYTGLLCAAGSDAACTQTGSSANSEAQLYVFRNIVIVMSGSVPMMRLIDIDQSTGVFTTAQTIDLTVSAPQTVYLALSDENNNTLPAGTTIRATTNNGVIEVGSSYEIGNNISNRPVLLPFVIGEEGSANQKSSGTLTITVETPLGQPSSVNLTILDAG
ncbi:invasin [Shewanella sp. OPT22]|nr:invasin [Shewanella sp. OPT22]